MRVTDWVYHMVLEFTGVKYVISYNSSLWSLGLRWHFIFTKIQLSHYHNGKFSWNSSSIKLLYIFWNNGRSPCILKKISAIWPFWLEKVLIKHTSIVEEVAQHNVSSCNNNRFSINCWYSSCKSYQVKFILVS